MVFHLFHILTKIYIACRVKIGLKKIYISQFQAYLLPIFIILEFFKFDDGKSNNHKTNGFD
jgi:hypothetical protein